MRSIPKWQLEFFQNFICDDLYDLIGVLIHDPSTELNVRFCSDGNHFCSERAWLKQVREKIEKLKGKGFLELFQQFNFPNRGLLKLLRRYFKDPCISEEWGKKRLPQIQNLIKEYRQGFQKPQTFTKDGWRSFPGFIEKEGLGMVKVLPHAVEKFKKRALNPSPQSLIKFFHLSSRQHFNERERKKRERKHGEGARFYVYPLEFLRFVVVFDPEKYNYDGWVLKTVEVDTNLANCLARHPGFCSFGK